MSTLNQLASLTNSGGANALQGVNSAGWFLDKNHEEWE